jgi:hypothetical protein
MINVTISILTDTSFLFIVDCFIDKKLPKMCILKFYAGPKKLPKWYFSKARCKAL